MLEIKNLCAAYGQKRVLHQLYTRFEAGQFTALIGPNGCGKSTLIKTLAGVKGVESGDVLGCPDHIPASQFIAYLPQTRLAHPLMTVQDIIALGRAPHRRPFGRKNSADKNAIETALKTTDLEALRHKPYGTLSGGQQARVLLARALAVEAQILLVDEPVASLDPYYQLVILDVLKAEAAAGKTVIAALHDLSLIDQFSDKAILMQAGKIVAEGKTEAVLTDNNLEQVFHIKKTGGKFRPV
jgi:iron complex transport system ATP-binding protein